ncbi:MAG TPA: flagellar biosynthetic protein FliR [Gammaproteobacteria bacterium]|nr:flagellar biosynthetic protein FliR [Gammaproteobacteria bacterium]
MTVTSGQLADWIGAFFWPLMRIGMMFTVAPIFGGRLVPVRARLMVALAVTWVVVPSLPPPPAVDPISVQGLLISVQQLLIGAAMGFALQLVFAALVVGGQVVAMSMGLGFASMVDPQNGVQVPVLSQYYVAVATLLFLAMNGHLALIGVLMDGFHAMPVGASGIGAAGYWNLVAWAGHMFSGAVLIALPAVSALLMVNIAFGVITRAAPQLNIFAVGFPVTMLIGFVVILVTLPSMLPQLSHLVTSSFALMGGFGAH